MDRTNLADFETVDGTMAMHSVRGCGDKFKLLVRRFSCFCDRCMKHEYDNCETRELIGIWDEETQAYCNDWAVHKIVQKTGRGIAQRRESEKAAELAAANVYAKGLKAGTWVALDCGKRGDCDGFGFWLGRTTSESYLATAEFKDGVTDIEVGDHVVDLQYFGRCNAEEPLEFEREPARETIHVESILRVPDIEVAEQPGQAEEAVQEIQLAHTTSVRIMGEYAARHNAARRVV